jgi:hypothetical protein
MSIIDEPIINDNEDELLLTCGEDLEPIEEVIEYIDDDYILNFSNEETKIQLIDILSYNDPHPEKNKFLWNKRALLYEKLIRPMICNNHFIIPVIECKDVCIIKKEQEKLLKTVEDETVVYTTMQNVLQKRQQLIKSKESETTMVKKLKNQERLWVVNSDLTDVHYIKTNIENDTYAFAKSNKTIYLFRDDEVHIIGYGYIRPNIKKTIIFDTNKYIKFVKSLKKDDDVVLLFNADGRKIQGKVFYIKDENKYVFIHKLKQYNFYLDRINESEFFLSHPDKFDVEYCKYALLKKNIVFHLLPDDNDGRKTFQMFLPNTRELIQYEKDLNFLNRYVFEKYIREKYSICDDVKTYIDTLNDTVQNHIDKYIKFENKNHAKSQQKKRFFHDFVSSYHLLDFEHFALPYPFRNNYNDTEYHRMKYITSSYDYGASYYIKVFREELDVYYKYVSKNKHSIVKELEKTKSLLEQNNASFGKCELNIPNLKKTYKTLKDLEKDNFIDLSDVSIGDYALLDIEGTTKKYYKRHVIENNKNRLSVWIYDRDISLNLCQEKIKDNQICTYDKADDLCKDKEYYRIQNKLHHLEIRKHLLEKWMNFMNSFETVKSDLAKDDENNKLLYLQNKMTLPSSHMTFDDKIDHSDFIGIEDDTRIHFDEVDSNMIYSALPTDTNQRNHNSKEIHMIDRFILLSGFDISDNDRTLMTKIYNYYFSDSLETKLKKLEREHDKNIKEELKKIEKKQKEALSKIDEKNRDELKRKNKQILEQKKREFEKRKKTELEIESLKERENFYINMISIIIAILTIIIQKNIPNVKIVSPSVSCSKVFSIEGHPINNNEKSLIKYLICVFKEKLSSTNPMYSVLTSNKKLELTVKSKIDKLLQKRQYLKTTIEENQTKLEQFKKQIHKFNHEIPWITYKPVYQHTTTIRIRNSIPFFISELLNKQCTEYHALQNIHDGFMNYLLEINKDLSQIYKNVRKDQEVQKVLIQGKIIINSIREPNTNLFLEKPIEINNYKKIKNMQVLEDENKTYPDFIRPLTDSDYWENLPNILIERLNNLFHKLNIDVNIYNEIERLLFRNQEQILKTRNSYMLILENSVVSDFSKISNNWYVDEDWTNQFKYMKKRRSEKDRIKNILEKHQDLLTLIEEIHENKPYVEHLTTIKIEIPKYLSRLSRNNQEIMNMIMIYNHIFIEFLYKLVKNEREDLYNLDEVNTDENQLATKIIRYMCQMVITKLKVNIYDSLYLSRVNEELRETVKEGIIGKLDKLTDEERKAFLQMQKKGIVTWKNIPETFDPLDDVSGSDAAEVGVFKSEQ